MIVVDTSVWVDYFNGTPTPEADRLDALLGDAPLAVGDLILAEVLQGFRHDRDHDAARERLTALTVFEMLGVEGALRSASAYRRRDHRLLLHRQWPRAAVRGSRLRSVRRAPRPAHGLSGPGPDLRP